MESGLIDPELAIDGLEDPQTRIRSEGGLLNFARFSLLCLTWLLALVKVHVSLLRLALYFFCVCAKVESGSSRKKKKKAF